MKATCLLVIMVLGLAYCSLGQAQYEVHQGASFRQQSRIQFQGILGEDTARIYAIDAEFGMRKLKSIYLTTFDKLSLKKTGSYEIDLASQDSLNYEPAEIVLFHNNILVVAQASLANDGGRVWKLFQLNHQGKTIKSSEITTIAHSKTPMVSPILHADEAQEVISLYIPFPNSTGAKQHWLVQLWSAELEKLAEVESTLPYRDKHFEMDDLQRHPLGEVALIGKQIQGIPIESDRQLKMNNKFVLFIVDPVSRETVELELSLRDKWIRDAKLIHQANHWIVTGFYSDTQESGITGLYYLKLTASGELVAAVLNPFGTTKKSNLPEHTFGRGHYKSVDLVFRPNGQLVLIGEQQFKEITPRYDSRQDLTAYNDVFYFDELFIASFDDNGKLQNTRVLPKFQTSVNDQGAYSSIFVANTAKSLVLLFNDHKNNRGTNSLEVKHFKRMHAYQKSYMATWEILDDGTVARDNILPGDFKQIVKPAGALQAATNNIYFMAEQGPNLHLVKIHHEAGR